MLDLEQLANHTGSVFGARSKQPSNEQFENKIATRLKSFPQETPIWVEDESRLIGTCCIPNSFYKQMQKAPLLFLKIDKEIRINHLLKEYKELSFTDLYTGIYKLRKRIGYEKIDQLFQALLSNNYQKTASLLLNYYDKAYQHGLNQRSFVYEY